MSRSLPLGTRFLLLIALGLCLKAAAQPASLPVLKLTGIVNLPNQRCAVVEQPASPRSWDRHLILSEGQRQENIAVSKIQVESGSVRLLRFATNAATVRFTAITNPPAFGLVLENCNLTSVLNLYAGFRNRTVLRSPAVADASLSLVAATTNVAAAAAAIEKALSAQGAATILDGDKFVMVVPQGEVSRVNPHSSQLEAVPAQDLIPAGALNFPAAVLMSVAPIYAELLGRKFDPNTPAPLNGIIVLKNQTPLSKAECLYALDTLFEWQGVKLVPQGDNLIKAVLIPKK